MDKLKEKLDAAFDTDGAQIVKTQTAPSGKWAFTLSMTALLCALYAVLVWGTVTFRNSLPNGNSLAVVLLVILSLALVFFLFRLWLCFAVDVRSERKAESTLYIRKNGKRYYYTQGKHVTKFEYEGGRIAVVGNDYDKFEDEAALSPLAGRFSRALQRRSSSYSTLTADFWYAKICDWEYEVRERGIYAHLGGEHVQIDLDEQGKVTEINYFGRPDCLYDSCSPFKYFDGKLPGKYSIKYTFAPTEQSEIVLSPIFGEAITDYIMPTPDPTAVTVLHKAE